MWQALRLSLRRRWLGCGKPKSADCWDSQYREHEWDRLGGEREFPRYAMLAALTRRFAKAAPDVHDIGCGTGVLSEHLALADGAGRYTGSDVSKEAISQAVATRGHRGTFRVADAETDAYRADDPFDVIVFNEVLYYFDDPQLVMERTLSRLRPGGIVLISLWKPSRHVALLRRLRRSVRCRYSVVVGGEGGEPWRVSVEEPLPRSA